MLYNKVERGNPANSGVPKLWYLILKSMGLIKEKEVTKRVADETTLNSKEAEFAVAQLFKVVTDYLLNGKTVQLGESGTFRLTSHSEIDFARSPSHGSDQSVADHHGKRIKSLNNYRILIY
jgi:predicted histone-like DNA-binding protein